MDRLFTMDSNEMIQQLVNVEEEMREDSYNNCEFEAESLSQNALRYIQMVYDYVKNSYKPELCTVLSMMKELYRITVTGEYTYVLDLEDIEYKNDVFEKMVGNSGKEEVLYATRLLRYYYLVREKKHHSYKTWKNMEYIYEKIKNFDWLGKSEKKEKKVMKEKELKEMEFLFTLRSHMDRNMIGQDVLKKKLCSVLYQFKYYDVRTTLLIVGPSGSGKNHMIETIRSFPELGYPVISYDCSALTPNGFNGSDVRDIFKKVRKSLPTSSSMNFPGGNNRDSKCIVFLDEVDKIINFNHDSNGESVNAMVQQQLLSSLAGTEIIEGIDTSRVLFILGGAFPRIDDLNKNRNPIGFNSATECTIDYKNSLREQIIAIGCEREFIGRIEDIVKMSALTRENLKEILMDENIGVFTKKKEIYKASGLSLDIEEDTIDAIVDLIEKESAGARSVKNIMNQFVDSQYFYDMKVGGYDTMKIHKGMLKGEAPIFLRG